MAGNPRLTVAGTLTLVDPVVFSRWDRGELAVYGELNISAGHKLFWEGGTIAGSGTDPMDIFIDHGLLSIEEKAQYLGAGIQVGGTADFATLRIQNNQRDIFLTESV